MRVELPVVCALNEKLEKPLHELSFHYVIESTGYSMLTSFGPDSRFAVLGKMKPCLTLYKRVGELIRFMVLPCLSLGQESSSSKAMYTS